MATSPALPNPSWIGFETMIKILRRINGFYQAIERGCSATAAGLIMVTMLLTSADVIGRYVFNSPIIGAYGISEVIMVGIVFLGIAYVQSVKGHVQVEVVTSWLSPRAQVTIDTFAYTLALVILALMTWRSGALAWDAFIKGDTSMSLLAFPLWPGKSLVPIGTGLFCLRLISDIVSNINRLRRGELIIIKKEQIVD